MAIATVIAQPVAMRATDHARPSFGASSYDNHPKKPAEFLWVLSARAVMVYLDRRGHPHVHGFGRWMIQPHPHGKTLRDHHPIEIPSGLRKSRAVLIGRLYSRA